MKPDVYFIKESDLSAFIGLVRQGRLYGTVKRDGQCTYENIPEDEINRIVLKTIPPVESIKGFLFPAREKVATYSSQGSSNNSEGVCSPEKQQTIVGVRACDLCAREILDKIFLEQDTKDPFYDQRRRNTIVISSDCDEPKDSCFCNMVQGKPYPEKCFDLNLSPLQDGYLVSVGSEKGAEILHQADNLLTEATAAQLDERDKRRRLVMEKLKEINARFGTFSEVQNMATRQPTEKWQEATSTCVECGACSFICPTCHCFFLYDQPVEESSSENERTKTWDSCILGNFAKMAGVGGMKPTPRPQLRNRFENRIRHKFEWMPENIKLIGCVGCGRCIEACLDGSDIRDIFKEFGK